MSQPVLILIQGAPASGKTTLRKRLDADLRIPSLSKDDIKELMFSKFTQSDKEFSRIQGKASIAMLLSFARSLLESNQSVMIECAFYADIARPEVRELLTETHAECLEIFCHVDEDVRKKRFSERAQDGTRHPGHLDIKVADSINANVYDKLSVGKVIDLNTTSGIDQNEYDNIVDVARRYLTEKGE